MSTPVDDADVVAAVARAEASANEARVAADAAQAALRETTDALARVLAQGGTRLDVLDEAVDAMAGLRTLLGDVLAKVDSMATVDDVRAGMGTVVRDTGARRHLTVLRLGLAVVWLVIASGWVVTEHVEHCSPGSKAQRVTQGILDPDVSVARLRALARQAPPAWCDVSMPFIAHAPLADWPSSANVLGAAMYAVAMAGTLVVVRRRSWEAGTPQLHGTPIPSGP